jgi:hypothetical protein
MCTGNRRGVFLPSTIAHDFGAHFLDSECCATWLMSKIHPDGPHCPGCGVGINDEKRLKALLSDKRIRCPQCGRFFSMLSRSFLSGTHLGCSEIVLLALLLGLDVPIKTVSGLTRQTDETVRTYERKFRMLQIAGRLLQELEGAS